MYFNNVFDLSQQLFRSTMRLIKESDRALIGVIKLTGCPSKPAMLNKTSISCAFHREQKCSVAIRSC